jgi:hypothetical protein
MTCRSTTDRHPQPDPDARYDHLESPTTVSDRTVEARDVVGAQPVGSVS